MPAFLGGTAILAVLLGMLAFSAAGILSSHDTFRVKVGVVKSDDQFLSEKAMDMVISMESVGSLCDFIYMDKKEGLSKLSNGEIAALMELPENLVEGIMDGRNIPVTVTCAKNSDLQAAIFRELTDAGSSMLTSSQAAIYAADDYVTAQGRDSEIAVIEKDFNDVFLSIVLSRDSVFRKERVSSTGAVSAPVYFGISMSIMLLMLLGIPAAPILGSEGRTFYMKLKTYGVGQTFVTVIRVIMVTAMYLLVLGIEAAVLAKYGFISFGVGTMLRMLLVGAASAAMTVCIFSIFSNPAMGILVQFTLAVAMTFLSGGIVPAVFLPEKVEQIGRFMPTKMLAAAAEGIFTGRACPYVPVLVCICVSIVLASLANSCREEAQLWD